MPVKTIMEAKKHIRIERASAPIINLMFSTGNQEASVRYWSCRAFPIGAWVERARPYILTTKKTQSTTLARAQVAWNIFNARFCCLGMSKLAKTAKMGKSQINLRIAGIKRI
jgi:hypothetical protein